MLHAIAYKRGYLILAMIFCLFAFNCEASEEQEPPAIGNFIFPNSQQPGPLVGFGQNILPKNVTQVFLFADDYAGVNEHFIDLIPSVIYGITDNLSIMLNAPYAASYQQGSNKSSGIEDAFVQLEYAFYNHDTSTYADQATVVFNVTAPTGSINKNPPTGAGSPSVFLGSTLNRTYVDWFVFAAPGVTLTTANNGTKSGNSFLYQFGLGRNIKDTNGWLLAWMTELTGTYSQRNRLQGTINPDSGGNVVYLTPSFWASTKKFIFQLGVGVPVEQHLLGSQPRETYLLVANIGWTVA